MKFKSGIQKQLILILLGAKEPITMVELAEMVSLSEKTVRTYLKDLGDVLEKNGIELIKRPNVGVKYVFLRRNFKTY